LKYLTPGYETKNHIVGACFQNASYKKPGKHEANQNDMGQKRSREWRLGGRSWKGGVIFELIS
jgi:hypothetical protein